MTYTVTLDVPKALWWTSNSRIHPHARARIRHEGRLP